LPWGKGRPGVLNLQQVEVQDGKTSGLDLGFRAGRGSILWRQLGGTATNDITALGSAYL
jgi:hypothetical protein